MGVMGRIEQSMGALEFDRDSPVVRTQEITNDQYKDAVRAHRYPAKEHIRRAASHIGTPRRSEYIFLTGSTLIPLGLSDEFHEFLQESNFYYCTGSTQPDWFLFYSIPDDKLTVFVPRPITGRMVAYLGQSETTDEVLARYDVDAAHYHDGLGSVLGRIPAVHYTLSDDNLVLALTRARRVKDKTELDLMRKASQISSFAHLVIARGLGHNRYESEAEIDIDFRRICASRGAKRQSYAPIVGSGTNASVLHYSTNDKSLGGAELVLIDAAGSINGYRSDVTRTYPIGGKFSELGKKLYSLVLKMQVDSIEMLKPGVKMNDLQNYCHTLLAAKMVEWNWVNCPLEKCVELKLSEVFFMHGLGHQIGLDTHDVDLWDHISSSAFFPKEVSSACEQDRRGRFVTTDSVRVQRPLGIGNVVTIEPGVYFNDYYLKLFYDDTKLGQYYNPDVIDKWKHLGGVRIEDCILVTKDGFEELSTMQKQIDDIEALCSGTADI